MVNVEGHDKYLADLHGRSFGYHSTASRLEYLAVAPGSNTWRIMDWYHHRFMARRPILVPSWHLPRCIVAAAGPPRALVCSAWAVVSTGEHLLRFRMLSICFDQLKMLKLPSELQEYSSDLPGFTWICLILFVFQTGRHPA